MKITNILFLVLVLVGGNACSDWFDVLPKTSIKSEKFFDDESGFQSALTGCYVRMTNDETYGKNLTWNFMEKLVQRYDNSVGQTADVYKYKDAAHSKNTLNDIWLNSYRTIGNINNLITQLDDHGHDVIKTKGNWELMKGEALALHAYHHFDLLRMFGPIYKDNPKSLSIPYRTTFSSEKSRLVPADSVCGFIIDNLIEAEKLLVNDPLIWNINAKDPFIGYRGHRMNKYATKALLARVYLYRGSASDLVEAARLAKEVIDKSGLTLVGDNSKDHAMFDETLFGLNMYNMEERVRNYFTKAEGRLGSELWITEKNAKDLFEGDVVGVNDIRFRNNYGFYFGGVNGMMTRKYLTGSDANYNDKVPLIRLSEMYLIAAEATKDDTYLNKLRNVRGISRINDVKFSGNDEEMIDILKSEYSKEYFAEGQFFFFLKRHNQKTFYRSVVPMTAVQYIFPLPDNEREYGWTGE